MVYKSHLGEFEYWRQTQENDILHFWRENSKDFEKILFFSNFAKNKLKSAWKSYFKNQEKWPHFIS